MPLFCSVISEQLFTPSSESLDKVAPSDLNTEFHAVHQVHLCPWCLCGQFSPPHH